MTKASLRNLRIIINFWKSNSIFLGLPLYLEKPGIFYNFNMLSSKISNWHKKYITKIEFFVIIKIFFLLKNLFYFILQYLFNVFILFYTVSYIKFNFKQKIDPKLCTYNRVATLPGNLEKPWKTWNLTIKTKKPGILNKKT